MHKPSVMKTRFELTILQPQISACPENPENMLSHELGKFCLQCNKAVHDLKDLDAESLISYLQKNEGASICGSINPEILHQPVLKLHKMEKYTYQFKFILALFFAFGPLLFSCNEKQHNEIKQAIAISIEDKGETYLPPVQTPDSILNAISFNCDCVYEEDPEIILADTTKREILLDPVYIYGEQEVYEKVHLSGAMAYYCFTTVVEIDSVKPIDPEIIEINKQLPIVVFPNPARNEININYELKENGIAILSLFNINGQKIKDLVSTTNAEIGNYSEQYNVSDLPSGMYIFILVNNNQKEVFRLSVTH